MKPTRLIACLAALTVLAACGAAETDHADEASEAEMAGMAAPAATEAATGAPQSDVAPMGDAEAAGAEEEHDREGEGEHGGEGGEGGEGHDEGGEEGEEGGEYIGALATWDATRRGAHLTLRLNEAHTAFVGTVRNVSEATLCRVRVEVHLRPGPELGPTTPVNVAPGQEVNIDLPTDGNVVETWTAHPEISAC